MNGPTRLTAPLGFLSDEDLDSELTHAGRMAYEARKAIDALWAILKSNDPHPGGLPWSETQPEAWSAIEAARAVCTSWRIREWQIIDEMDDRAAEEID